jgi:hypothetical protein
MHPSLLVQVLAAKTDQPLPEAARAATAVARFEKR